MNVESTLTVIAAAAGPDQIVLTLPHVWGGLF
jgi:hypothetical protein